MLLLNTILAGELLTTDTILIPLLSSYTLLLIPAMVLFTVPNTLNYYKMTSFIQMLILINGVFIIGMFGFMITNI